MRVMRWFFKSFFSQRVNGGVLQLTLGISIIIVFFCASMIMLSFYSRMSLLKHSLNLTLRDNAYSGIQVALARRSEVPFHQIEKVDLFGEAIDSVQWVRKPWGLFELINVRAFRGKLFFEKSAMVSTSPSGIGNAALYIPENNSSIYLVGNTLIEGDAYLPERGFTTGFINGRTFLGRKLMEGTKLRSSGEMPELDSTLISMVCGLLNGLPNSGYELNPIESISDRHVYPFVGYNTSYFFSNKVVDVSTALSGNLIIHSTEKVRILKSASLEGLLVVAPEIEVEDNFVGSVQLFASKHIMVGSYVHLNYPSSLALLGQQSDSVIVVGDKSRLEGLVVIPGFDRDQASEAVFILDEGAVMHGFAYINGITEIKGSLWGHLTSKSIRASASETIYLNHMLDATISYKRRSENMPASLLWGGSGELVVAKWLK